MRALSNRNVVMAKFDAADFTGVWLASFGRPELRGAWFVSGGSGSGKTTFVLQLCKYLTQFRRVAYDSLEQGLSLSFQRAWERVGMEDAGNRIVMLVKEDLSALRGRLKRKQSPDVVVIDSVQYLHGLRWREYTALKDSYPDKLFIFISHEKENKKPDGNLANKMRYDADIKIRVEGYKAFVTTRYAMPELGEGGAEFTIWEEGAARYWAER